MSDVNYGRGYVYSIKYHLVWCVKYRHKVIEGEIAESLKELITEIAEKHNIKIIEMETDLDHIHLLIECSPQHYIPNMLKAFKGNSARAMFKKHPELKNKLWGGHLWNPSYFVCTVSENTQKQVEEYIKTQGKKAGAD